MTEPTIEQLKDDLKSLQIVGGSQEAREAFWRLRDNYARSARLAVALDAQLQQEREGREKLAKIVTRLKSDFAEYHFPDGDPRNLMALEAYIEELDAALAQQSGETL